MPVSPRFIQPSEKPSRLQLAITEWQRQLIALQDATHDERPGRTATARG
jgi:hypothetical protein